jgi:alkylation response protein AidB-like acyl-CoA dehydrogenase
MHERMAGAEAEPLVDITSMIALAGSIRWRTGHAIDDLRVRERIADWQVVSQGLKYTTYRALTRLSRGEEPGPEFSIGKLLNAAQMQAMAGFALELADRAGAATNQGPAALAKAADAWLRSVAARIAGGTDEILLNIVAERVLGMPKEPDTDRNRPFNEAWI